MIKKAHGVKPLNQLINLVPDIKKSIDDNGAITFQIHTSIKVGFTDGSTEDFHITSDKTEILINNENEMFKDIENHITNIKEKFEIHQFKTSGGSIKYV